MEISYDGSNQGTSWRETAFDDSSWKSGVAPLGYPVGENRAMYCNVNTIINYGPDARKEISNFLFPNNF